MSFFAGNAQLTPFVGCPDVNLSVTRAGNNSANTNPYSIHSVNTITGAPSIVSTPILNPAGTANLQVNGVGLNTADGYLYGLSSEIPTIPMALPVRPPMPFYRVGSNGNSLQLGNVYGPALTGIENASVVSAAAGEMDQFNNYYFSAATGVIAINFFNPLASTFTPTGLYIGKLSLVSTYSGGTSTLTPTYLKVTSTDPNCAAYLTSVYTAVDINSATNTGLRDFVFNQTDNQLISYVTFPDASNPGTFLGQMLKLNPNTGILTAVAPAVTLPFATASNEMAGTLIDKDGNFLILFTNGVMYKANVNGSGLFDGSISVLNSSTGLPTTLRGDMASCGTSINAGPLPVRFKSFDVVENNSSVSIQWKTAYENDVVEFIIEKSATIDGNWVTVTTLPASNNLNGFSYTSSDNFATSGTTYYRIVSVDKNGLKKYSEIKKVVIRSGKVSISIFPNPVLTSISIKKSTPFIGNEKVFLYDELGRNQLLRINRKSESLIEIDATQLSKGVHFIRFQDENGKVITHSFLKK